MSRYQEFLAAKAAIRAHPDWSDRQVAEYIRVNPDLDGPGMSGIAQARKDLEAGDHARPDVRPG